MDTARHAAASARATIAIVAVNAAIMVPFGVSVVASGNTEFLIYGGVIILQALGVLAMHRRVGFSTAVLVALTVWLVLHLSGGTVPIPPRFSEPGRPCTLYNLRLHPDLPKYDQVIHALGFGAATCAAFEALDALARPRRGVGLFLALCCIGMGLGAFNEVLEFAVTRILPDTNVGGYDNTGWDLVSNLVGSAAAAAVLCRPRARPGAPYPAP